MKRVFLAILALLAGLVAQANPALARINGANDAEIGAFETLRPGVRTSAVQPSPLCPPAARPERRDRVAGGVKPRRGPVYIPSVLFGPDRAIE